jgi:glycerol-3-phosphate dehydrogenase
VDRFDLAIIGAGVSGASIARRLSAFELSVALLDKEADVSFGTSKANSGIIHGGFHHNRKYLKARLELQGAGMYPQLHRELGFPYRQCGIVVAAFSPEEMTISEHLYRQGVENGSLGIELCGAARIRDLEPKLHEDVVGGLYAPAGGIIEPYRFVFSLVENARDNGVEVITDFDVSAAERLGDTFEISARDGRKLRADYVVNAAGLYADEVSRIFGAEEYRIQPRKGEYHLLDRRTPACPKRVVFPVPTPVSKGMLVIPTVEGTVLIGPTADETPDKEDLRTTASRQEEIVRSARRLVPSVSHQDIIASFSGLRPTLEGGDFYIAESDRQPGFIQVAGIQSPGLTAAPAVGEYVKELLKSAGCRLTEKQRFTAVLSPVSRTRTESDETIQAAWEADPREGQIVCRCETVTRGEIVTAIRQGHRTLDGIKFSSRAGAGRCQGSFCLPRLLELIALEADAPITKATKRGRESWVIRETLPGTPERPETNGAPGDNPAAAENQAPAWIPAAGDNPAAAENPVPGGAASIRSRRTDVLIIGGGAAGMAAAKEVAARGLGAIIVDREERPGGVLRQCIHNGFGIHEFGEELTGPEYAERYVSDLQGTGVRFLGGTTALGVTRENGGFDLRALSEERGLERIHGRAVVLAMGSRERNRGSIRIPGTRPAGIFTAGAAQRLVNISGYVPGRRVVIIGSGDIGLIMARRMKFVGAEVEAVIEIQPVPSGINRNIVQCLDDFGIPLYLGHVVTEIHGADRVSGVTVAPLENGVPQSDAGFELECDTLLLSVGLIPENELSREIGVALDHQTNGPVVDSRLMTNVPGVFAAGNVLHIHDLVDFVAEESSRAGKAAAAYLKGEAEPQELPIVAGSNVRYVAPGKIRLDGENRLYLRSLIAKVGAVVEVRIAGEVWKQFKQHHVQPSEMISIELSGAEAEKLIRGTKNGERVEVALV